MKQFEEIYLAIWCLLMPVTGTILLPGVQGTIPAYVLAFASVILIYGRIQAGEVTPVMLQYGRAFFSIFLLWMFLLVASQASLILSNRHDFGDVFMVDNLDTDVIFRRTIFTQSLYFLACVMIGLFFRYFFEERWMRYVLWGGYLLAIYGIYEWVFFLIFQRSGDFLVNRSFGEHTASWTQGINFGGINLVRIKSTLGEPTFFAGAVIPYLCLALEARKPILIAMLLFTAVFSTSTACYIALVTLFAVNSVWTGRIRWESLGVLGLVALFLAAMAHYFPENFDALFADKFNGDNDSGSIRLNGMAAQMDFLSSLCTGNWLFGIGFGNAYLNIFMGLLVNTGLVGLATFSWIILRPVIFLPTTAGSVGLKAAILGIVILGLLSLSELFLPTTWMFLGIACQRLAQHQQEQAALRPRRVIRPLVPLSHPSL